LPSSDQYRTCKLCSSTKIEKLYFSRRLALPVFVCRECGLRFIGRVFSKAEQASFYQDSAAYADFAKAEREVPAARKRLTLLAKSLVDYLGGSSPTQSVQARLLDAGCGAGDFLAVARELGFRVWGQEISAPAAKLAQDCHGLEVENRELELIDRPGHFNAVTFIGVLEHVLDPRVTLTNLHRLMAPNGVLLIYTPVWGLYDHFFAFVARISGGRLTRPIDRRINTAHLQIFPRKTLLRAIEGLGMTILASEEICEYNLPIDLYLESVGFTHPVLKNAVTRSVQFLIEKRLFFRNNIRLFARRLEPEAAAA